MVSVLAGWIWVSKICNENGYGSEYDRFLRQWARARLDCGLALVRPWRTVLTVGNPLKLKPRWPSALQMV